MKVVVASMFLLFLSTSACCFAEGGCPPGQYSQHGQGWQTCVPNPGSSDEGEQRATPPAVWASKWLAIAADNRKGVLGTSINRFTQAEAEQFALTDCRNKGGAECGVQISYRNGCVAMVVGDKVINTNGGSTQSEAEQKGIHMCEKDDSNCRVYYSACSQAIRVQ